MAYYTLNTTEMKLELKHLAPYLPYNLKIYSESTKHEYKLSYMPAIDEELFIEEVLRVYWMKPILRPLSDLNKKIVHKSKSYYVLDLCTSISVEDENNLLLGVIPEYWENIKYNLEQTRGYNSMDYSIVATLFEHHFDVFGLIENGLAIDINTLVLN